MGWLSAHQENWPKKENDAEKLQQMGGGISVGLAAGAGAVPPTCSLLYSHISGRLRAANTLDFWPFSSRVPDFWQCAVLGGRGREPPRRWSVTFFCSVEHHSFLWAAWGGQG